MGKVIPWELFKKLKFYPTTKKYMHNQESDRENEACKILCDFWDINNSHNPDQKTRPNDK